jgi:pimeloyl-ACP methyl ester carboxylesterase
MNAARWIRWGAPAALVGGAICVGFAYRRDLAAARERVKTGSKIAQTRCGVIEYGIHGEGPPVLAVHGAGGGFDQGLMVGEKLRGFRIIAPSRFGYLRTPLPRDGSPEAQADAHACLLDALGVRRAAVVGVSAGAPSAVQLCLRHPERCAALILLVPLAWSDHRETERRRLSPSAAFVLEHTARSELGFWLATRLLRGLMVQTMLGTPPADVRAASAADRRRTYEMLDLIRPISLRGPGLRNDQAVVQSLQRPELEKVAAPTLVVGVENCGYGTYEPACYTAEHIPGARFVSYPRGGHLWLGHDAELLAEVQALLARAGVESAQADVVQE